MSNNLNRKIKPLGVAAVLGSVLVPAILVTNYAKNAIPSNESATALDKTEISAQTIALNQIAVSPKTTTPNKTKLSPKTTTPNKSTTPKTSSCILRQEVMDAEKAWGDAIVAIGKAYTNGANYKELAAETVDELYAYDEGTVLFKPTKAAQEQFRLTKQEAASYFVTGIVPEDHGFAIQPWSKVRFENAGTIIDCNYALAMGNYYFTDANTGKEAKAEFTFGYRKSKDGKLLIDLHHSSFPYHSSK